MLSLQDLEFDYSDKPLLKNISFSVLPGELLHIRGANGTGKTTLLKVMAGLLQPLHGTVSFQGNCIWENLGAYQKQLSYLGHKLGINLRLTPYENYQFAPQLYVNPIDLEEALDAFQLKQVEHTISYLLSAGQRRKVALIRLLLSKASIWLLDEPFVALDKGAIAYLKKRIEDHLEQKGSVILTSHQDLCIEKASYREYSL